MVNECLETGDFLLMEKKSTIQDIAAMAGVAREKSHTQHNAKKEREFHGSPPMPETGCGEREGTVTGRSVLFQAN